MPDPAAALLAELKQLRKGRGVFEQNRQVGPLLLAMCELTGEHNAAVVRQRLIERLTDLAAALPDDLGMAATAALAVHPEARQMFLTERIQWLAARLDRDVRTVRRRVDEGMAQLADVAIGLSAGAAQLSGATVTTPASHRDDYYVSSLSAVVVITADGPRSIETRRIVAVQDELDKVELAVSLPHDPTAEMPDLGVEVLYGGRLQERRQAGASLFRFELALPRALRAGDTHEFAMLLRVPGSRPIRTHYVHTSPRRCDAFDLRIRFDEPPGQVWQVDGLFHRELDELDPPRSLLHPDPAGDLHLRFDRLKPGFGYGVQWREPDARPPS
ncbi:MAG TPA: hypothetical protein VGD67_04365 [Pseudonocardiaceae bacterium]